MPGGSVVSRETSMTLKLMPILENGDRLTRTEFERRYQVLPEVKKAELVEGVVYMASPVRYQQHGNLTVKLSPGCKFMLLPPQG